MQDEATFNAELQLTFLSEAQEMLEETEAEFLGIESKPDDAVRLDKIFRIVHTVKGSAKVAGFTQLGNFAHAFEALLARIRDKTLTVSPGVVDVLLACNDCLRDFVTTLRANSNASLDVTSIEARIAATQAFAGQDIKPTMHKVLVVDDSPIVRREIRQLLVGSPYVVIEAVDGFEGLKQIENNPDTALVIIDVNMPNMDGLTMAEKMRDDRAGRGQKKMPAVMLTTESSKDLMARGKEAGVLGWAIKPPRKDVILSILSRVIEVKK